MAEVDARIHLALACCVTALETEPKVPPPARALILGAMRLLLDANGYIKRKAKHNTTVFRKIKRRANEHTDPGHENAAQLR